jgi:hypothetical protein
MSESSLINTQISTLPALRERRQALLQERDTIRSAQSTGGKRISAIDSELGQLDAEIRGLRPYHFRVSDHALLRYLERCKGLDVEALREELLPKDQNVIEAMNKLGSGTYPVGTTHRIVLKVDTIVTVLT